MGNLKHSACLFIPSSDMHGYNRQLFGDDSIFHYGFCGGSPYFGPSIYEGMSLFYLHRTEQNSKLFLCRRDWEKWCCVGQLAMVVRS